MGREELKKSSATNINNLFALIFWVCYKEKNPSNFHFSLLLHCTGCSFETMIDNLFILEGYF